MIIVVAGAQGSLGQLVCEALLARAQSQGKTVLVRGLVRKDKARTTATTPSGLPVAEADSGLKIEPVDYTSREDLVRVCTGAHCVASTLQGLDDVILGVQSRLLEAAIDNNVRRFIPSDFWVY